MVKNLLSAINIVRHLKKKIIIDILAGQAVLQITKNFCNSILDIFEGSAQHAHTI